MRERLSLAQARRVALAAQGFGARDTGSVGRATLARLVRRLGVVQIDSVNVLVRSQYLPAFSRLGAYERSDLDALSHRRPRRLFEYWAHEASLVPVESYPLFRWRMERAREGRSMWQNVARVGLEQRDLVQRVLEAVRSRGAITASQFEARTSRESWWGWSDAKRAFEYLFWSGDLTSARRTSSFERVYDLPERVLPPAVLTTATPDEAQAHRELLLIGARALGVATERDLRDYFRLDVATARTALDQLVEGGTLLPVTVEGWKAQAYLSPDARLPRSVAGSALLSPFDSLVWNRERTHRLFDFHYRIEIYTPAHKRIHGYYVLPYLMDERLAARVDLKADRENSTLLVRRVHIEPNVKVTDVRERLHSDLTKLATWLGLERLRTPQAQRFVESSVIATTSAPSS